MQPTNTVAELVRADERLKREFSLITLPVLILHGTADKVTNPNGSRLFFETAGSADKTLKLYDGHVHDLLNDLDKQVVMADIVGWLDARVRPGSRELDLRDVAIGGWHVPADGAGDLSRLMGRDLPLEAIPICPCRGVCQPVLVTWPNDGLPRLVSGSAK